jgi:calmodulin
MFRLSRMVTLSILLVGISQSCFDGACALIAFPATLPSRASSQRRPSNLCNDKYTYTYGGFGGGYGEINNINKAIDLPTQSSDGIYQLETERQYHLLLQSHPDKLVVVKFYASYCQACRALAPKFVAVKQDPQMQDLPVIWAEFQSSRTSKDLFRQLAVLTLPTVHFYDGSRGLIENFPCGPARVPLLKKKLARFLNERVDAETRKLKAPPVDGQTIVSAQPVTPRASREIIVDNELITAEHIFYLKDGLPFFRDLTDYEFKTMLGKAKLLTFNAGDLIIRQGMPGRTFYVLKSGVAEMSVRSRFDDPISTPSNYLGVVVNELKKFDYFGERALTTGEPLKASVRALEKVRCFAFDVDDIPESSILNRKRRATRDVVDKLNRRYELPADYTPEYAVNEREDCILELLVRFRQIRQAAKCFDYAMNTETNWGDQGEIARRSMLVSKLSPAQRDEFQKVFDIVDSNSRGKISLLEMKRFMNSARQKKSDAELRSIISRATHSQNTEYEISRDEFMGVMAEAEFYNLFTETFQELDKENTGYVRAGDLDEVLGGVRGLISDNPTNLIDSEDKDMLVDYEQFSKMLLGAAI